MKHRKIKFRFFCPPAKGFVEQYQFRGYVDDLFNEEDPNLIPVEYSGVEDLYEGDILQVTLPKWGKTYHGSIAFLAGAFAFKIHNPEGPLGILWLHQFPQYDAEYKKLGNIYEHPNLLNTL
jgi:hypothetical protein